MKFDFAIIGGGVMGLSLGLKLLEHSSSLKVVILEKESNFGEHASGRNSGVLHSGIYYNPDSLKAKFCKIGNLEIKKICKSENLFLNECGKVIVSQDSKEDTELFRIANRARKNNIDIEILEKKYLQKFEAKAKTNDYFIWSPSTAVVSPREIINHLKSKFVKYGGRFELHREVSIKESNSELYINQKGISANFIINAAGGGALKIAKKLGVGTEFSMLPIMGSYLVNKEHENFNFNSLIYPVPNPVNPFLGVHLTLNSNNQIKIGPSAIPTLGGYQYGIKPNFEVKDISEIIKCIKALYLSKSINLKNLVRTEFPNMHKNVMISKAQQLINIPLKVDQWEWHSSAIRSQLIDLTLKKFEYDFVIKNYLNSTHLLNVVSPGFTCSIPFSEWIISNNILTSNS